jgi:hypothetical protein
MLFQIFSACHLLDERINTYPFFMYVGSTSNDFAVFEKLLRVFCSHERLNICKHVCSERKNTVAFKNDQ